jgi:restriction endonuclease fold toxin 7 of polymorphic toxin system
MIRRDPVSLAFPTVDTGALRSAASWFGITSSNFSGNASDLSATLRSVGSAHGGWIGAARTAWDASGVRGVADLRTASDAFSRASQILGTLASQVDQARARYEAAMGRMEQAQGEADSAQSILDNPDSLINPEGPVGQRALAQQQQRLTDAVGTMNAARAEALEAQADAINAGSRAASALSDVAALAAGVGTFAGYSPAGAAVQGAEAPPDYPFLVLLLGSVGDNYLSGRAFQEAVMQALGLRENFQTFQAFVGARQVGVKPDSLGEGEVWEFKGVVYQYRSSQVLGQLATAAARGEPYELVIGPNTKLSDPVIKAVRAHPYGGEIVRMQEDGSFTDVAGNKVERAEGEGNGWKYPDDDDLPPTAGAGGGTLNHPQGFEADTEEQPEGEGEGGDPSNMVPMPFPEWWPAPMPMPMPIPEPIPVPVPIIP